MVPGKKNVLTYGTQGAQAVVRVECRDDIALTQKLKSQAGTRRSRSYKCRYFPKEAFNMQKFFKQPGKRLIKTYQESILFNY